MTYTQDTNGKPIYSALIRSGRAIVVGIGISNLPLITWLTGHGIQVTACDKKSKEELSPVLSRLGSDPALSLGDSYLDPLSSTADCVIFRSPGIRPDIPEFRKAVANGCTLVSEMELFFELCPAKIIGITGSDGKTTTTTLISEFLKLEYAGTGRKVYVGGNIGTPLLPVVEQMTPEDVAVVELSSFQLMTMPRSPEISVVTNLSPNHLNWHTDMNEYVTAKTNIFTHHPCQRLVVNYTNPESRSLAIPDLPEVFWFGRTQKPDSARRVFLEDGKITLEENGMSTAFCGIDEIRIPGAHNIENYMTAIAATYGLVSAETVRSVARSFGGVEHRIEFVRKFGGVDYYNSSIDSSPSRTNAALSSFKQRVIVIIGGRDKHLPLKPLIQTLETHAKAVVLTGESTDAVLACMRECAVKLGSSIPVVVEESFDSAVIRAKDIADPGDVVILSPAFTSFDHFRNFEERGRHFKDIVNGWDVPVSDHEEERI